MPPRFGGVDVLGDVADVIGVVVRIDRRGDRLVGHRRHGLR